MKAVRTVRTVLALALLAALSALAQSRADAQTEFVLDHFKCYAVAQAPFVNEFVQLKDQFDVDIPEQVLVRVPVLFCNPVAKSVSTSPTAPPTVTQIQHPDHHLKMYLITPPAAGTGGVRPAPAVDVTNQFSTSAQRLTLYQPIVLAVPTRKLRPLHKAPEGLDHFKCYIARGEPVQVPVSLQDQFDRQAVAATVIRPVLFCNPTAKTRVAAFAEITTPIQHPDAHLTCYVFAPPSPTTEPDELDEIPSRRVPVSNQFGRELLLITQARLLCAPSTKTIVQ